MEICALAKLREIAVEIYCFTGAAEIDLYQIASPSSSSAVFRELSSGCNHYGGTLVSATPHRAQGG